MHMPETFDLIVIGGGRGANLALAAAKAGKKVAVVEQSRLGGTCPNRGCVPSKLLIGFSEVARTIRESARHFISSSVDAIDTSLIFKSVDDWIVGVDPRYEKRITHAGATLLRGTARFTGKKIVSVGDRSYTAESIVIATGSRPRTPPYADLPVWTSDSLFPFENKSIPKKLLIIGGGFIACEMASFFEGVGTEVQVFSRGENLLNQEDREIEEIFRSEFEKTVSVHYAASLHGLSHVDGQFTALFSVQGKKETYHADQVLFAIGRTPNTDALNLEATGLKTDRRGFLAVDDSLETAVEGIYATGDVNGRYMLQHAATFENQYLVERLLQHKPDAIDQRLIAHAVFSHPEIASVGYTEEQLKASQINYVAATTNWLASARAMSHRIDYPSIKFLVDPVDYSILGCHMIGPEASTMIHEVMMLMHLKNDIREIPRMVHIHPSMNDALVAAAQNILAKIDV